MEESRRAQEAMKSFVREVVAGLVDEEKNVRVDGHVREQGYVLEVNVAPGDIGRVIGRGGATARALRSVVAAAAGKHRLRCELVLEDGPGRRNV